MSLPSVTFTVTVLSIQRLALVGTALILLVAMAFPLAYDAYQRHLVRERLVSVMTPDERVAFDNWKGDARSFAESLYKRCELSQGANAVECDRYKFAFAPEPH